MLLASCGSYCCTHVLFHQFDDNNILTWSLCFCSFRMVTRRWGALLAHYPFSWSLRSQSISVTLKLQISQYHKLACSLGRCYWTECCCLPWTMPGCIVRWPSSARSPFCSLRACSTTLLLEPRGERRACLWHRYSSLTLQIGCLCTDN